VRRDQVNLGLGPLRHDQRLLHRLQEPAQLRLESRISYGFEDRTKP
jgi:hypothetical protein